MVGVVIPVHDGERFLGEAVQSVLRQTHTDWCLVIVDDGSEDGSAAVAETFAARDPRIRVVQQPQGGAAAARNRGFAELPSAAETVIFLDADDVWEADALQTLAECLQAHPEAPAVHAIARTMDAQGRPREGTMEALQLERRAVGPHGVEVCAADRPTTFEVLVWWDCVPFDTVLFRRQTLEAVGPLDTDFHVFEDYDLLLRVSLLGPIPMVARTLLWRREHDTNISNDRSGMFLAIGQVRRKLRRLLANDPRRLQVARLAQRYTHRNNRRRELAFAAGCLQSGRLALGARHVGRAAVSGLKALCVAWGM